MTKLPKAVQEQIDEWISSWSEPFPEFEWPEFVEDLPQFLDYVFNMHELSDIDDRFIDKKLKKLYKKGMTVGEAFDELERTGHRPKLVTK